LVNDSPLVAIVERDLVFTAVVTSVAGTNYYTPVTYQWDFGNGHIETSTESSITYSYSTPGLWNITLIATNNVSSAMFTGKIHAFKGMYIFLCIKYVVVL